jgi:phosphoribosylanthranilate isomerase
MTFIKICGIRTPAVLRHCDDLGVDYVGLVFVAGSPRFLSVAEARGLLQEYRPRAKVVALTVDAPLGLLAELIHAVRPDFLQLHGQETPEYAKTVKEQFGVGIIKAIGVRTAADIERGALYPAADMLLYDAPPLPHQAGGTGQTADWGLFTGQGIRRPWLLAGGLRPDTAAQALRVTGADGVDVSSGVESALGIKDIDKISDFFRACR